MQGGGVDMQHHVGDGHSKFNGFFRAVEYAGIAVPALVAKGDLRNFILLGKMAEYLSGADISAGSAADAKISIDDWRHGVLLYLAGSTGTSGKAMGPRK